MLLVVNCVLFNISFPSVPVSYPRSQLRNLQFSSASSPQWSCPERGNHATPSWPVRSPPIVRRVTNPNPFRTAFVHHNISTFTTRPYLQSHKKLCICSELFMSLSQFFSFIIPTYGWTCWPSRFPWRRKGCWTRRCGCLWISGSFVFGLTEIGTAGRAFEDSKWLCKERRWSSMENAIKSSKNLLTCSFSIPWNLQKFFGIIFF